MAILSKGTDFSTGDQVTATNLNALVDSATFSAGAVDDTTTALDSSSPKKIIVKNGGIGTTQLADDAVGTAKIADSNVTKAKIENLNDYKVLGNVSGGAAAPAEVAILDEDDMASDSNTSLATQQSIKAYVDANALTPSYVGISSNSSLTITQTDTSTTTHTYPIANFVGTGFNAAKVTGFYVEITASCRRISVETIADVKATFPDGNDHILLGHSCDTPEDQTSESRGTVFCPVTQGQTNLVIKPTLSGNTKETTFTIVGCTQFV